RTVLSGISSPNNQDYLFSPSNPYTLSADGRSIIYADSSNQLVKLDIGTGNLLRDSSDVGEKNFLTDEQGQFWYATETLAGSHIYSLARQDLSSWTPDSSFSPTAITDMASLQFSVFQDRVTYLSTSGSIVSRDLQRLSDFKTELSPSDISFNTTDGQFALSSDGGLVADMPSANTLRIIDLKTQQEALFSLDASLSVSSLSFNEDGTALFYVNTADGALRTLDITRGPVPDLTNERLLKSPSGSLGYSGLSVKGGSHNANFHIHNGSGSFQEAILTGGDARLFRLGISKTTLHTEADAQEALSSLQEAVERVILQRSVLGAEEARLSKSHDSLMAYGQELESSDSIIRDVDIAKETSELVMAQIWQETSLGMMSQANLRAQAVLRLLYNS
ncbi:MAG: flagellin domain protein, partial [Chlamydiales bacterium]|nr:flagellin domain protein [Chlamydiales bacterium]